MSRHSPRLSKFLDFRSRLTQPSYLVMIKIVQCLGVRCFETSFIEQGSADKRPGVLKRLADSPSRWFCAHVCQLEHGRNHDVQARVRIAQRGFGLYRARGARENKT